MDDVHLLNSRPSQSSLGRNQLTDQQASGIMDFQINAYNSWPATQPSTLQPSGPEQQDAVDNIFNMQYYPGNLAQEQVNLKALPPPDDRRDGDTIQYLQSVPQNHDSISWTSQLSSSNIIIMGFPMSAYNSSLSGGRSDADTIRYLQRRVRELEQECLRIKAALAVGPASGLPNAPASAHFQGQWRARTDARKRIICSLNRAGNALCSWHDSRRERRMFPPQNAPPGFLNCGCTYDEALFEESLARHGVGGYHPGESVCMDPALRNPLLKLLMQRYGYKDDFDHDPLTGTWNPGEEPTLCEQKAQAGSLLRRRNDSLQ